MNFKTREKTKALWGNEDPTILYGTVVQEPETITRTEKARQFYFNEKFVRSMFAQNLAKSNIKKHDSEDTLDELGRFKAFKLDLEAKNAQLQGFELFPLAIVACYHPFAQLHREGYRLFLKSMGFFEEFPLEHQGIMRVMNNGKLERLDLTEKYQLNALLIACLSDKKRTLSAWENAQFLKAISDLPKLLLS